MANTFPRPPLWSPDVPTRRWAKWPGDLDLLTLKVVAKSCVMWATSVPILVFLGLSVIDLGPMYTTDRCQTDRRQIASSLMPPPRGQVIISQLNKNQNHYYIQKNTHMLSYLQTTAQIHVQSAQRDHTAVIYNSTSYKLQIIFFRQWMSINSSKTITLLACLWRYAASCSITKWSQMTFQGHRHTVLMIA